LKRALLLLAILVAGSNLFAADLRVLLMMGSAKDVQTALTQGAQLNDQDGDPTALMTAAMTNTDGGVMGVLVKAGEKVNAQTSDGKTALMFAAQSGNGVAVSALVKLGADVTLQVDANGSYSLADADRLAALDDLGVACLEQPLAPDALLDHAALATRLRTPIGLDESIVSANAAHDAVAVGACAVVSIKSALVGGIDAARRTHDVCVAANVAARAGGMLETGVGRAVLVALAALPGFTIPGDCSASDRYFDEDVTEPFELDDGRIRVPAGPGIGVTPRAEVLARCTIARERWRAGR